MSPKKQDAYRVQISPIRRVKLGSNYQQRVIDKYNHSQLQTVTEEVNASTQYDQIEPEFQNLKNMLQFSDSRRQAAEQYINDKDLKGGNNIPFIRVPRAHLLKPQI